jgi:hypothetical protein
VRGCRKQWVVGSSGSVSETSSAGKGALIEIPCGATGTAETRGPSTTQVLALSTQVLASLSG